MHIPVLESEIRSLFLETFPEGGFLVDATLGLGGHAYSLLSCRKVRSFLGFDRDHENLERAKDRLIGMDTPLTFINASFQDLDGELDKHNLGLIDFILYDLGVSSIHLDEGRLGFSLRFDGPLDMRFDRSQGICARDIVMGYDVRDLSRIFEGYGEEPKSWIIANEIVRRRKEMDINTTFKLKNLIENISYDKKSSLRVFQALRIAVNDEFSHIESSLEQACGRLAPDGIIAVITFHSLEDRLVKQFFQKKLEHDIDPVTGQIKVPSAFAKYTKKPIIPTDQEILLNPRSRSAKLRIIQKINSHER